MDFYRKARHPTCSLWIFWVFFGLCQRCLASYQALENWYSVYAPYSQYVCPVGQNVNLTCTITGSAPSKQEHLHSFWRFSNNRNPDCSHKRHEQNVTNHHTLVHTVHSRVFHLNLQNLSQVDSGDYCCYVVATMNKHLRHEAHSYIQLQVKTDDPNLQTCIFQSSDGDNGKSTAAALAIVSCIIGILCLPLILFLVYKQRKAVTNRRAQELVRMDSEAQGIENPVFDDPPSGNVTGTTEQRPRLNFMAARQQSESGRHLLSEPNTPLSPPGPNDVFFPALEPVPDSPDPTSV
ncbi:V-type immunoglobulin domain-containing suppressor of T-cell activation [Spea bombifrons]|uniref:V-type immunoglobulin domain-containing suppressor of T-cell activation n=1 Tax=Spea bombifrons TaxID=233779 RepID=UPI00234BC2B0|nr:V-type immunoglobulin domain-containing suppressor of T-cell activation [Spea bombifrons]